MHIHQQYSLLHYLEQTVLKLQKQITMNHNRVQLNTLDYDLDIDGPQPPRRHVNTAVVSVQDNFTPSELEILDVVESQAEDHITEESADPIYYNSEEPHEYEDLPWDIQINTTAPYQTTAEHNIDSEEVPELEDWDNGQFAVAESILITHHNTHSESEQIRWDYTQQLLDLMDNQYYEEETPVNQLQYSSPDPDYYGSPQRAPHDPNGYYPPPPNPADIQHWYM